MPRCGCADACSCLITAGEGISVEGIGTLENPYEITSESSDLIGRIEFTDEGNVDFTVTGVGTLNDPTTVFADAVLAVADLTDVSDNTPNDGEVMVWRIDHWEYEEQTGSGSGTGLPPGGTDGQVLTKQSATDGDADWETFSGGSGSAVVEQIYSSLRKHSAATSIANGTWTNVPLDTPVYEDGIVWGTPTATAFNIPVDGYYQIDSAVQFAINATGYRAASIYLNGTQVAYTSATPGASSFVGMPLSTTLKCVAGDYITVRCWQSSGAALALTGSSAGNFLAVTKVPEQAPGGGGVVVERPMASRRQHLAATTLTTGVVTKVPFDSEVVSDGITWDAGLAAFLAPVDGYYDVEGEITFATNVTGARVAYIYVGASIQGAFSCHTPGGAAANFSLTVKALAGQEISIRAQQTSGGNLTVGGNAAYNNVSITKVPVSYAGSAVSTYGERTYASARAHTVATSIPNGAHTPIPFNTEQYTDGIPFTTDAFTVPVAGYYKVEAVGTIASNASGIRALSIMQNATFVDTTQVQPITTSGSTGMSISATVKAAVGDTIQVRIYQNSGVALTLAGGVNNNFVSITKVPAPVINGAAASGVWGTAPLLATTYGSGNDLVGDEIYIDTKGQLRSRPQQIAAQLSTALAPAYPVGYSEFYIPGADGANWPTNGSGIVVTHKTSNQVIVQQCSLWSAITTKVWMRTGSSTAWGPWVQVADSTLPVRAGRRKSTSQTLTAASTWYAVTFDVDVEGTAAIPYSNGVFTIEQAGVYQVNTNLLFGGLTAGGQSRIRVLISGGSVCEPVVNYGGSGDAMSLSKSWRMAVGDTFTIQAWASVAGGNITGSGVSYSVVDITRISA